MGATAVAILIRKEKDLVGHFQNARATSEATALSLDALQLDSNLAFRRLVKRAVIRETSRGTYFLDQPSWNAMRESRRSRVLVILLIAFLFFAVPIAVTIVGRTANDAPTTEIAQ